MHGKRCRDWVWKEVGRREQITPQRGGENQIKDVDRIAKTEVSCHVFPDVNKPPSLFTEIHCLGHDSCEGAGHRPDLPPHLSLPALSIGCWWRMEQVKLWCCARTSTWQQCWAWAFLSGKLCRTVCRAEAECPFRMGKLLARGWVGYSGSDCSMLGSSLSWTGFPFADFPPCLPLHIHWQHTLSFLSV